MRTEY